MARKQGGKAPAVTPTHQPTTRIGVRSTDGAPQPDEVLRAWRAAGIGADSALAKTARQISEAAVQNNSLRGLAEKIALSARADPALQEMVHRWQKQDAQLRAIQQAAITPRRLLRDVLPSLPSAEVRASAAIEARTVELVEISDRTSVQIGQVAGIAQTVLERSPKGF
jgi:Tfp pilus assembly protein FimV